MVAVGKRFNPIHWQEFTHFQRTTRRWQRYEIAVALLIVASMLGMMGYLVSVNNNYRALLFVVPAIWIFHAVVALRSILAGVTVISREHVGLTWDALVLTGVSGRQILLGKFLAAMRSILPYTILLSVLRCAMLPLMSLELTRVYARFATRYVGSSGGSSLAYESSAAIDWVPWAWLAAPVLTVLLSVLESAACVALGLVASAVTRRSISAAVLAITVRFMPVAIFSAYARYSLGNTFFWRYWGFTPFTLADGGTVSLMQLAFPLISWTQGDHAAALPGIIGSALMLLGFTLVSLGVALWTIRRSGALQHRAAAHMALGYRVYRA
jgi:hypothetical protein